MKPKLPKRDQAVIAAHEAGMHDRVPKPDTCRDCAAEARFEAVGKAAIENAPEPIKAIAKRVKVTTIPADDPIVVESVPVVTVPAEPINAGDTRESWMLAAVEAMRPWIAETGATCGPVRISFGWPGGRGSKVGVRGQCWMPTVIKDGVPAIFISPDQSSEDTVTLLGIILHEMNHAAGNWGHTGGFAKMAAALGFEKPWTSSVGKGEDLRARLAALAEKLGPLDHGQINPEQWLPGTRRLILDPQTGEPVQGGPKVQTTRMRKVSCPHDGYTLRATTKWLDIAVPACPICDWPMDVEQKEV